MNDTETQVDAVKMLRDCARKALWRLEQSEPDAKTIAAQMKQTAEFVLIGDGLTPPLRGGRKE